MGSRQSDDLSGKTFAISFFAINFSMISSLLPAAASCPVDHVPVWFMRQAGRSLPEYRRIRGNGSILDTVRSAELAAEITLQPVKRYGVDAAILYSDIMVPLTAVNFGIEITQGRGPCVKEPFRSESDLARLRRLEPETDIPFVIETVKLVVEELRDSGTPLIGFAGGPFTVASYLIEGGSSKDYVETKTMMRADPSLFDRLMNNLAVMAVDFLTAQVDAGAAAVQIFDSWAGILTATEYKRFVLPSVRLIMDSTAYLGVPRIYFALSASHLLDQIAVSGCDVVSVDWKMPLSAVKGQLKNGSNKLSVQGNLDPTYCFAPWDAIEKEVMRILMEGGGRGHIFNLGHGVLPGTDPEVLNRIVELVHSVAPDSLVGSVW